MHKELICCDQEKLGFRITPKYLKTNTLPSAEPEIMMGDVVGIQEHFEREGRD